MRRSQMAPLIMLGALLLLSVLCFMAIGADAQQQVKDPYKVLIADWHCRWQHSQYCTREMNHREAASMKIFKKARAICCVCLVV
jgi:hypothetical protein